MLFCGKPLAWNLGDPTGSMTSTTQNGTLSAFHPMKGAMTTQTFRGLFNLSPYHWRGDKPNLAAFNPAFVDLMGGSQISSSDMAVFTTFANSVLFLPNPYQNLDGSLPTSFNGGNAVNGEADFMTLALTTPGNQTCDQCHTSNPGPGSNRLIDPKREQPLKVPELRNIYQKLTYNTYNRFATETIDGFGLNHDGSASLFTDFFRISAFKGYSQTEKKDIAAYEQCFDTGTAPAVGYTRTITALNLSDPTVQSDWTTLQSQSGLGNIDLIGRGTIQGQIHGLLYQPTSANYLVNTGAAYTRAQLQTFIQGHDTITFMGVYPGTASTH
jgi:hypothetical protein